MYAFLYQAGRLRGRSEQRSSAALKDEHVPRATASAELEQQELFLLPPPGLLLL